jgi:hypothetical protein
MIFYVGFALSQCKAKTVVYLRRVTLWNVFRKSSDAVSEGIGIYVTRHRSLALRSRSAV